MGRSRCRVLVVSGAAVGLIVGAGGCHAFDDNSPAREVDRHVLENEITSHMTDSNSDKPQSVACPAGLPAKVGAQVKCKMKVDGPPDEVNVTATVTSIEGKTVIYHFLKSIEQDRVAKMIRDKQPNEAVTCPEDLKGFVGATLRCQLITGNKTYGVNVTVTDVPGPRVNFDFEVDNEPK